MARQTEKEKRDFVDHILTTAQDETETLTQAGFDPKLRIEGLKSKSTLLKEAEVAQQKAQAAAIDATKASNEALKDAYDDASSFVNLIEGLLGKDNSLVHKLRKFRN
ncbi:hypothetical protein [Carboxylicivirga linearis]|uniref:Phage protein n=1 Tax=Carboxylicivirga linearis TaxID=1628157 RepID=A0ABS5JZK6_9BACT|nr:hypothetical protein [Carboxylicivirga linearis]MBS2100235.1 hypothetical protein [Carboxylicivirga linearis]